MNFINKIKIGQRLILVFIIIVALILLNAVYIYKSTNTLSDKLWSLYNVNLLSIDFLIEADRDAYQSNLA